jgi:hypothetical protein
VRKTSCQATEILIGKFALDSERFAGREQRQAQDNLAQYISCPLISLKKIRYEPFKGRARFDTAYSDYCKDNVHLFEALEFIAKLTQHIPPKGFRLIRLCGLYSSRIKGRWE